MIYVQPYLAAYAHVMEHVTLQVRSQGGPPTGEMSLHLHSHMSRRKSVLGHSDLRQAEALAAVAGIGSSVLLMWQVEGNKIAQTTYAAQDACPCTAEVAGSFCRVNATRMSSGKF